MDRRPAADPRIRSLGWPGRLLAALALGLVAWRAWVEFVG
jgi:hypothetical protein